MAITCRSDPPPSLECRRVAERCSWPPSGRQRLSTHECFRAYLAYLESSSGSKGAIAESSGPGAAMPRCSSCSIARLQSHEADALPAAHGVVPVQLTSSENCPAATQSLNLDSGIWNRSAGRHVRTHILPHPALSANPMDSSRAFAQSRSWMPNKSLTSKAAPPPPQAMTCFSMPRPYLQLEESASKLHS